MNDFGAPVNANAAMSFEAFGQRRDPEQGLITPWTPALQQDLDTSSRHGYTGHEEVEAAGIIHMNGRIYDPKLGRFLQADPIVQDPYNSQSLNRFSYVLNNPLSMTDPTGYMSIGDIIKTVVAIYISYQTGIYAYGLWGESAYAAAAAVAFAGGFAAGAVQTGNSSESIDFGVILFGWDSSISNDIAKQ